ncbi:hypothetical protein [Paenibacillus xylanexedens]|uniref:hypothetical protein n=1 Tax=Paenibacillus xylanexedens TaxID=528191 RepID=UPI000F96E3B0|nr:hypothetical protein [Paenibacillus xylanexedens]RPK31215.1 hypothetical protein EDO6_01842 [Paenibacillus xylanexedens]
MKKPSEHLIAMLGQPYDSRRVQQVLQSFGVKRMPKASGYFIDDIIWSVKSSIRLDVYRSPKIHELTGRDDLNMDEWMIGAVHFLAPGSDDRINTPFPGQLPAGMTMNSTPDEFIREYGQPALYEEGEWLGGSGPFWLGVNPASISPLSMKRTRTTVQ